MTELTPSELHALLAGGDPPLVLDVREPWEREICALDGALEIPLGSLSRRIHEIPPGRTVAVICHHGVRSALAAGLLLREGWDAVNVTGGIDRWARDVDGTMIRY